MTWEEVCAVAREFPGVEDGSYHGYPALRVGGKFLVRLGDDRKSVEFKAIDAGEREMLLAAAAKIYFLPERFHGTGIFARLSTLNRKTLRGLLMQRWTAIAPKTLVKAHQHTKS